MRKLLILFCLFYSIALIGQTKKQLKGEKLQSSRKYYKAIKIYTDILEKDKNNYRVLANRGICFFFVEDYDKCLEDLLKFDEFNPTNPKVNALIGSAYSFKSMWSDGAHYLQLSLKYGYQPNAQFYFYLGSNYFFLEENEDALIYLNKSYDLDSNYSGTLNNLAWVNLDSNPEKSCHYFKKAFVLDSLSYRNVNNLGYSHLLCGNLEIAFNYFKRAELLAPNNSFVYRNYGLYYMYMEDKHLACLNLQKAIELNIIEEWGMKYISELQNYCSEE